MCVFGFLVCICTRCSKLGSARGVEYLQHRLHLLQHYCTLASFYLLLRAEHYREQRTAEVGVHQAAGAVAMAANSATRHPCLEQILAARALIEELEPLHEKIRPQVRFFSCLYLATQAGSHILDIGRCVTL